MIRVRRREFITLLGGASAWPLAARAQQAAVPVVGFVSGGSPDTFGYLVNAFRQGLSDTGYIEGRNVAIEFRWAEGQYDRLPSLLADLVQRQVRVLAATTTPGALAAKAATSLIPIVFASDGDPVRLGLVASLSRPGGNVTGVTQLNVEVGPKRVELMHELIPAARAIALLVNPANPLAQPVLNDSQAANGASQEGYAPFVAAFRQGLKEAGYVEGQNVTIEYRWAEGQYDRLPALAADLVQQKVSVVAATTTPAALAAKAATSTVPIVFTTGGDPIKLGLVATLGRPGGNVTGSTQLSVEVGPKRFR